MTQRRRVVITGLGIVSPLGCDLGMFWHLLSHGESGIKPITTFDTSPFNASLAGERSVEGRGVKGGDGLNAAFAMAQQVPKHAQIAAQRRHDSQSGNHDSTTLCHDSTSSCIADIAAPSSRWL